MKQAKDAIPNPSLKNARERRGWTLEDMAEAVGTKAYTVWRWERGVTTPSAHFRRRLSEVLGYSIEDLGLLHGGVRSDRSKQPANLGAGEISVISENATAKGSLLVMPMLNFELVGKSDHTQRILQVLTASHEQSILSITGLPGVGKTALALSIARNKAFSDHFSDGVIWAALGPSANPMAVLRAIEGALGNDVNQLPEAGTLSDLARQISTRIGQRRMLFVIDDAWRIEDALALQVGGPYCAYLATTRFPEIAYRFAGENV